MEPTAESGPDCFELRWFWWFNVAFDVRGTWLSVELSDDDDCVRFTFTNRLVLVNVAVDCSFGFLDFDWVFSLIVFTSLTSSLVIISDDVWLCSDISRPDSCVTFVHCRFTVAFDCLWSFFLSFGLDIEFESVPTPDVSFSDIDN